MSDQRDTSATARRARRRQLNSLDSVLVLAFTVGALIAQMLFDTLIGGVVTASPSAWYAVPSLVNHGALVLLTALAEWTCLASRRTASVQIVGA